jgi:hypothetical protein
MTDREWNKIRLLSIINPDIDPDKLTKYFCSNCKKYFDCDIIRGYATETIVKGRKENTIKFRQDGREYHIYKCFEEKEDENKKN